MPIHEQARWIWADPEKYPDIQRCPVNFMAEKPPGQRFAVCAFRYRKQLKDRPLRVIFSVSGDSTYRLECNGKYIGRGPVAAGGDFECPSPMPYVYYSEYEFIPDSDTLDIYAEVKMGSSAMTEYSCGGGGFILSAEAFYKNGKSESIYTSEKWECRPLPEHISDTVSDYRAEAPEWSKATISPIARVLRPSPIKNIEEHTVIPAKFSEFTVQSGDTETRIFQLDRIYAAYPFIQIIGDSVISVTVDAIETEESEKRASEINTSKSLYHRCLRMFSVGALRITVSNQGESAVTVSKVGAIATEYPCASSLVNERREDREGDFFCSDEYLNKLYEVCRHTERICRQSLHLDSPMHQEVLACTGDYMIQNHIDAFAFGDLSLSRFDLVRTAQIMRIKGAKMFHTTYSLLWVQMLYDYYMYTGDIRIFDETYEEMGLLLERFNTYLGSSGVLENAPNYMFVDWVKVDEYTLHHPPKALGQTVLNAFYYRALTVAQEICHIVGDDIKEKRYKKRAATLKTSYNRCFYDVERRLYFSGSNSGDSTLAPPYKWLPENPLKRYYGVHENVLSSLYGLCDPFERQALLVRTLEDESLTQVQPYFMHYVLDAVYSAGLWGRYGMTLLQKWQECLDKTEKGLAEGWGDFVGDFSHAWGGTPAYQLPARISGIKILSPGFERISLTPRLYGLESANIRIPTRYGAIKIELKSGKSPKITVPDGITVE